MNTFCANDPSFFFVWGGREKVRKVRRGGTRRESIKLVVREKGEGKSEQKREKKKVREREGERERVSERERESTVVFLYSCILAQILK